MPAVISTALITTALMTIAIISTAVITAAVSTAEATDQALIYTLMNGLQLTLRQQVRPIGQQQAQWLAVRGCTDCCRGLSASDTLRSALPFAMQATSRPYMLGSRIAV